MTGKILNKRSLITGSIPTTEQLAIGEIGINVPDGKIYIQKSGSSGQSIESAITSNSTTAIGELTLSGSLILSGSSEINSGSVLDINADTIDFEFDYLSFSGSAEITGNLIVTEATGSFTGSFTGDGSGLTNLPSAGVGIKLNNQVIGGVKSYIEESDVLEIPQYYQYNVVGNLVIDGTVNSLGEINLL
jgi:hypothetical protein